MGEGSDILEAALWYAAHRVPVFPLDERGKKPRTRHGFMDATTDAVRVRQWWEQWPEANIGVPTGKTSGLLVVDCDPRNGGPLDRSDLVEQLGSIPATAEAITGGGGRHVYFRYAGGAVPKTLMPGVDLKGDGGYVVVPPSIHQSGNRYEWDGMNDRDALLSLAEVPAWLREFIAAQSNHRTRFIASARRPARHMLTSDPGKWAKGERNNKLTSLAGFLRFRGMTPAAIESALLEENTQRCVPPLERAEVQRIACSIASYPAGVEPSGHHPNGFVPPGYPDTFSALLDVIRFAADLPEFPVLLFLIERTLGYGKAGDYVSISQMVGGVYSCGNHSWIRKGCGLSKASIAKALRSLVRPDLPLLATKRRRSPERGYEPTEYRVNWLVLSEYIAKRKHEPSNPLVSSGDKPLVHQRDIHNQYWEQEESRREAT